MKAFQEALRSIKGAGGMDGWRRHDLRVFAAVEESRVIWASVALMILLLAGKIFVERTMGDEMELHCIHIWVIDWWLPELLKGVVRVC